MAAQMASACSVQDRQQEGCLVAATWQALQGEDSSGLESQVVNFPLQPSFRGRAVDKLWQNSTCVFFWNVNYHSCQQTNTAPSFEGTGFGCRAGVWSQAVLSERLTTGKPIHFLQSWRVDFIGVRKWARNLPGKAIMILAKSQGSSQAVFQAFCSVFHSLRLMYSSPLFLPTSKNSLPVSEKRGERCKVQPGQMIHRLGTQSKWVCFVKLFLRLFFLKRVQCKTRLLLNLAWALRLQHYTKMGIKSFPLNHKQNITGKCTEKLNWPRILQPLNQAKIMRQICLRQPSQLATQIGCACDTGENISPNEINVLIAPHTNLFTKLVISTGFRVSLAVPYSTKHWTLFFILGLVLTFSTKGA